MKRWPIIFAVVCLAVDLLWADDHVRIQTGQIEIVDIDGGKSVDEMAVFPAGGIPNRPLLVAAHGSGGSGSLEITNWIDLARQHNFTIVCPTFLSSVSALFVSEDASYFTDCLNWIQNNLRYNKKSVEMTGFSGGGFPVWYLATRRPDFFNGLFLQSGNFDVNEDFGLDLDGWVSKPIRIIWGKEDSPTVIAQNLRC